MLASASPRRRELLAALVAGFEVAAADIPEPMGDDPRETAITLAKAKAHAVAARMPGAVVLAADTVVHDGTQPYGKPADAAEAASMLRSLRGRAHTVLTGMAVAAGARLATAWSEARVTMAALPDDAIDAYVASGSPLDKAGAYAIQDEHVPTVATLEGCYCCVVGLPLWKTRSLLESAGLPCRAPDSTYPRCTTCPDRP